MKRDLASLIDLMKDRTVMYIGDLSITRFALFIDGYNFAVYERENNNEFYDHIRVFNKWLAKNYLITESSLGWDTILLRIAGDEKAALALFWIKWDEFQAERKMKSSRKQQYD